MYLSFKCSIAQSYEKRFGLPILDCFLFELEDGTLSVTVSDSETTMVTTVEVNESDTNGRFAVVAKTLLDALKEIPEQPLTFEINPDNYEITVQYQNGKFIRILPQHVCSSDLRTFKT